MRVSVQQVTSMLGASCRETAHLQGQESLEVTAVCRDTKDVSAGALFVCIKGARLDGHDFAAQAVEAGAVALLVTRVLPHIAVPQWVVADTVQALGVLANAWRKAFTGVVIAITGSAGKTTVKEVLSDIIATSGKKVARSMRNFNNQIGLPLSMLATTGQEDVWVMEAGISQPHDMDDLGAILQPNVALILNVGAAHTEGLGKKGVAFHKSRLLAHVQPHTSKPLACPKGFVCADYADLRKEAQELCQDIQYFSGDNAPEAVYLASYMGRCAGVHGGKGKYAVRKQLDASGGAQRFEVLAPFYGSYGAENVSAIVAVAECIDIDVFSIQQGFLQASLPEQRFNVKKVGAWHIVDDSYNANPLSMKRMLLATVEMAKAHDNSPCYAVLGAMGELGEVAAVEHEKLGQELAHMGIQTIFWAGDYADDVLRGLTAHEYTGNFVQVKSVAHFTNRWKKLHLHPGYVLCKGSRSNKLEELVNIVHLYAHTIPVNDGTPHKHEELTGDTDVL